MSTGTHPFYDQWTSQDNSNWLAGTNGPTYGALPTLTALPYSMTFNFSMFNSSILNCSVNGTNSLTYFYVSTNSTTTTVSRRSGGACAVISWQQHPVVEANGVLERQRTGDWVRLTSDRRRRTMTFRGRAYSWIPRGNAICLHEHDATASGELARITRTNTGVSLHLTITAFNSGFFEPSVIAAVLFLSGRNID